MPDAPDQSAVVVLEPCPFCGGAARLTAAAGYTFVTCDQCETVGNGYQEKSKAVEAWNRRAAPKPTLSGCAAIYAPVTLNSLGRGPADKGDTDRIEHQVWDPETCETLCVAKDEETARWIVAALSSPLPGEE